MKSKQILEEVMIYDPRAKTSPRPIVYVERLDDSCVLLSARCWVENTKYWMTKCELTEKIKCRFDNEGITFAFPQLDVHMVEGNQSNYGVSDKSIKGCQINQYTLAGMRWNRGDS